MVGTASSQLTEFHQLNTGQSARSFELYIIHYRFQWKQVGMKILCGYDLEHQSDWWPLGGGCTYMCNNHSAHQKQRELVCRQQIKYNQSWPDSTDGDLKPRPESTRGQLSFHMLAN